LAVGDEVLMMGTPALATKHKPHQGKGRFGKKKTGESKKYIANKIILRKLHKLCTRCGRAPYQETHHKDGNRQHNEIHNLQPLCRKCHKAIHRQQGLVPIPHAKGKCTRIAIITHICNPKIEATYDIQMPSPNNNFVANGFVVHNSWSFNRSHAVAYGMVTYWCMLLKAHHPFEWAAACLRNARNEEQCISLLRELDAEGYKYKDFDINLSEINWSIKKGVLIGGLTNIKGIGPKKAADIMARRAAGKQLTEATIKKLTEAETPFAYNKVFEARVRFKHILEDPAKYKIQSKIWSLCDITSEMEGEFVFLGKLVKKNLRDLNEPIHVAKRGGEYLSGQTLYLICTVEDNTSSIYVAVNQRDYMELGKPIIETGRIGDWYLWKGYLRRGFRKIYVQRVWPESRFNPEYKE